MKNASVYMSAEALRIEQWERDGLAALVGPLSRGELLLDMSRERKETPCGTCCCIGGWVAFYEGVNEIAYVDSPEYNDPLRQLYWPGVDSEAYRATAPQAARAIVNFLTLGDPRWDDVMREPADEIGAA